MEEKEIKEKILKLLSARDVCYLSAGEATHSKVISKILKVDYEKIKKIMKQLKREGYVIYENKSYRRCEDYEMQEYVTFRNIGWLLTDKARETKIYKEEYEKEKKIFNKCFGGTDAR